MCDGKLDWLACCAFLPTFTPKVAVVFSKQQNIPIWICVVDFLLRGNAG
ncbi:hypothetical protein [Bartonella raoultii]|uniref:Uncharacterized protein n=1 Tax=Bartonella raoultii TaxID=1457020 RepID=A0ABS7I578_9HYPH|nr:hypothetical protein [Bartonella raoultii]MBX4335201.1 hypothetical protein [Bartonella raoultii]